MSVARSHTARSTRHFSVTRLACLAVLAALLHSSIAQGAETHYVCPDGCDYSTIDDALDDSATTGDTILVLAGTYRFNGVNGTSDKDASSGSPTVLRAQGQVIIDGADPFGGETWTQGSGSIYGASRSYTLMILPRDSSQSTACYVFVGDARYKFVHNDFTTLNEGEWSFDSTTSRVYVRMVGNVSPAGSDIYVTDIRRAQGLRALRCNNLVIDGFTIKRTSGAGILIQGHASADDTLIARATGIVVKNCNISNCYKQGIQLAWTTGAAITNNIAASNGDHGIHLVRSDLTSITRNTSYLNDRPLWVRGGIAGIKIGAGSTPTTRVSDVNVDYNVVHGNEDTGIDIQGAQRVVVRRNLTYKNRDHGFDNNTTDYTAFINNVVFGNDHRGLSVENTSRRVSVFNNIFMHNAWRVATVGNNEEISEMELNDTTGFVSNHNVINPLPGTDIPGEGDEHDRHVVDYPGTGTTYSDTFRGHQLATGQDAVSDSTMPVFTDTSTCNFALAGDGTTYAIDAAKTNMTGWLTPMWLSLDPYGAAPHDGPHKVNTGDGHPYADIGAFEFDPRPGPTDSLTATCEPSQSGEWRLSWTAVADDSLLSAGVVAAYDVRYSTSPITAESWDGAQSLGGPPPQTPGQVQQWWLFGPELRYVRFKAKDHNGHWSALSNEVPIDPAVAGDCGESWYGGGGGGEGEQHEDGLIGRGPSLTSLRRPGGGPDSVGTGENTILNGTPTGTRGADLLPIDAVQNAAGSYLAHLRVTRGYGTLVDGVKLRFVDHPVGTEAFACGSTVVAGRRSQASQAATETGADVTNLLNGTGGVFNAAAAVAVTISTPLDSLQTPLVIECGNGGMRGHAIIVESQSPAGWREIGAVYPRRVSSATVIDSVPAGPVRLRFTGYAHVSSVARLAQETANVTSAWGGLEGAVSSSAGDVLSAVGVEDTVATALVGPDTLVAVFSGPPLGQDVVRSAFLEVSATPVSGATARFHARSFNPSAPTQFALYQNVPNPFRGSTTIRLDLPVGRMVRLEIFDVSGRRVRTLINHFMPAGRQSVAWNHRDDAGVDLDAGVYFNRLQVDAFRDRKKLILMP